MLVEFNPFGNNNASDLERLRLSEDLLQRDSANGPEPKPRGIARLFNRMTRRNAASQEQYGALRDDEEAKVPEFRPAEMTLRQTKAVQKLGLGKFLLKGLADCDIDQQEALVRHEVIRLADKCKDDAQVRNTFNAIFDLATGFPDMYNDVANYYRRIAAFSAALHSLPQRRLSDHCLREILGTNRAPASMNGVARRWTHVLNAAIAVGIMEAMPGATPSERTMAIDVACGGRSGPTLTLEARAVLQNEQLCEQDKLLYLQARCGGGGKAEDVAQFVLERPLEAAALWKAVVETPCRDDVEPSGVRAGRFKALGCTPEQLLEPLEAFQSRFQSEMDLKGNLIKLIAADIASRAEVVYV